MTQPIADHYDVLLVGAGISGITAAHYLQESCPTKTFAILEAREALGGTWDLFRYPGIRSDSDMYTLGFSFRPWTGKKAIADGPDILQYLHDTVEAEGIGDKIFYSTKAVAADWNSDKARWTVTVENTKTGETRTVQTSFVFMCTGYYNYEEAYTPDFAGRDAYKGTFVHPQFWPEDLDYKDKNVVVIGSGATAVTLIPQLAKEARKVTMLQRSPSYVMSLPAVDAVAQSLQKHLPEKSAYRLTRMKNIGLSSAIYKFCRTFPKPARAFILKETKRQVGEVLDVDVHFTPAYNPWEQRLCAVPNSDLFRALRAGTADVVTDQIDTFTPDGIRLKSGKELPADIIVSATGLKMKFLSGMPMHVDGKPIRIADGLAYKGLMLSGVPNLALVFGYTNASWTLKAELACQYVCRVLNYMDEMGVQTVTPVLDDPTMTTAPLTDLSSGYLQRGMQDMPQQGTKAPWRVHQNYFLDFMELRLKPIKGSGLRFR